MKKLRIPILLLLLLLFSLAASNLAYTGPGDRTVVGGGHICWRVKLVSDGSIVTHSCDYADIKPYEGDPLYRIIPYHTDIIYAPASISAAYTCSNPGNNGWCKSINPIVYTVYEPIPGQMITIVEDSGGTVCTINSASGSCSFYPPFLSHSWQRWAVSSWGDTSLAVTTDTKIDNILPSIVWHISSGGSYLAPLNVIAGAVDFESSLASLDISLDGGSTWLPFNATFALSVRTYNIEIRAIDYAGNVRINTVSNISVYAPTNTATFTPTNTATFTRTTHPTRTNTATIAPTFTPTNTATFTPTNTATFTPTNTATFTPTNTATFTPTNTATFTPTNTATLTPTNTATFVPTNTAVRYIPATATFFPWWTVTNTATPSSTPTATRTKRPSPTNTATLAPPLPTVTPEPPAPLAPVTPRVGWASVGLLALWLAFTSAALADPRHYSLRLLRETMTKIQKQ